MSWTDTPVMVLDFETTSADPCTTRPVQIGYAIFDPSDNSFTNELNSIVATGVRSHWQALKVHGITDARILEEGVPVKEAFESFIETITKYSDYPIMMYNAPFDFTILNQECKRHGLQLPKLSVLDPLVWARKFYSGPRDLVAMAQKFGIPHANAHDALADVRTTAKVALSITHANSTLGTASVKELQSLQKEWSRGSWPERLCAQPSESNESTDKKMTGKSVAGYTAAKNNSHKSPEEIELGNYEEQVAQAESRMLELEAELADMLRSIKWFKDQMTATIAPLILKIHILDVEVYAARGDKAGLDKALQALKALLGDYSGAPTAPPDSDADWQEKPADDELKSMFRDAAKQVHPDLADDEQDRKLRTRLMADLNEAYAKGDKDAIKKIVDQYNASEDAVQGEGVGYDLVRMIRRLSQIRNHITELESKKASLEQSDDWVNVLAAREAEDRGENYFRSFSEKLMKRIEYLETQIGHGFDIDDLVVAAQRVVDRFDNESEDPTELP
ncbi:MAG: exonuclease domain-containing protein [Chloroflexi bacterium]|nr:exonuclease domain-containing protein [Chloroflexota bacterium]MDA1282470.1 exonuclease domain-containing protein [Chloroflexota bacterium]